MTQLRRRLRAFALPLELIPHLLLVLGVAFSLAAGVCVSFGIHRPWTTLPVGIVLAAIGWRWLRPLPTEISSRPLRSTKIFLIALAIWVVVNAALAAEYLIVSRDPGFLTLTGLYLVDHPHTDIPSAGAIPAAQLQANLLADAPQAWNLRAEMIQPQGARMLPATISMAGWILGERGVLMANVAIGALGLVALYLLGRQFLAPRWALAGTFIFGGTVAHIALSRAAYSEPLTVVVLLAAVLWLIMGVKLNQAAVLACAGLASGATALVRIDGAAFASGTVLAAAVLLFFWTPGSLPTDMSSAQHGRGFLTGKRRVTLWAAFTGGQLVTLVGGYLSLWRWSEAYLARLWPQTEQVLFAYVAAVTISGLAVLARSRFAGQIRVSANFARLGAGLMALALVVLTSRPLWTKVHRSTTGAVDEFTNGVVASFQANAGMEVEPTRTYAEHTITWLSYYLTWPLVLLALLGITVAIYSGLRQRPEWLALLTALLLPSLLYFLKPEIVPDQIWAIRRFESATLPLFALMAAVGMVTVLRQSAYRVKRWAWVLICIAPITTWISIKPNDDYPISVAMHVFTVEMHGARAQINDLCETADGRPIVLAGTASHFGSLRLQCDVPVVLALVPPTTETLTNMRTIWDAEPIVLTRNPEWFTWSGAAPTLLESQIKQAEFALQRIPRKVMISEYSWYGGVITESGELETLTPKK